MTFTIVLALGVWAFLVALDRSSTPWWHRQPLGSLGAGEHARSAWAGLLLLVRLHELERGRRGTGPQECC